MNKTGWIICIIIFVFVTVFVLSLDNTSLTGRVKISNSNVEIGHENTEIVNGENVKVNLGGTNLNNRQLETSNNDFNINNSGSVNSGNINYNNSEIDYNNQGSEFSNSGGISYKNLDDSHLDAALNEADNISNKNPSQSKARNRYLYKNIDWATWKSNFVNKILDDSLSIHELDQYGEGAWFHYSFDVDEDGKISNISVFSLFLSDEDKNKVAALIKSYQYSDITVFPANTKRKSAKVSAVMMLSNTTQKSRPSDFKDSEKVKINLGN